MRLAAPWTAAVAIAMIALALSPAAVAATAPTPAIAWWVRPIALSAGPNLLRGGLADLRLALPLALLASASSIRGALLGLALPAHDADCVRRPEGSGCHCRTGVRRAR
jgi:hypothetical protein